MKGRLKINGIKKKRKIHFVLICYYPFETILQLNKHILTSYVEMKSSMFFIPYYNVN